MSDPPGGGRRAARHEAAAGARGAPGTQRASEVDAFAPVPAPFQRPSPNHDTRGTPACRARQPPRAASQPNVPTRRRSSAEGSLGTLTGPGRDAPGGGHAPESSRRPSTNGSSQPSRGVPVPRAPCASRAAPRELALPSDSCECAAAIDPERHTSSTSRVAAPAPARQIQPFGLRSGPRRPVQVAQGRRSCGVTDGSPPW
jgi:hypothetical protein